MQNDKIIYLDHAALTPPLSELLNSSDRRLRAASINPHAGNHHSEELLRTIKNGERQLLRRLGISEFEAEVIWTSGGTEANNLAILGVGRSFNNPTLLVESTAHKSLLEPALAAREEGATCLEVPVNRQGELQWRQTAMQGVVNTVLAGLCHVNNETGAVQDLMSAREWLNDQAPDAFLMVDGLQSFGKISIPWREANIDLLSIGGRKIGGPGQTGALIVRRGVPLQPLMYGGGQQGNVRPGTLDAPGILAFLEAVNAVCDKQKEHFKHVSRLNHYIQQKFNHDWSGPKPVIISPADGSPYILSLAFSGYEGAILVRLLARQNIIVGSGSACSAETRATSHVLQAMGITDKISRGLIRISFNHHNTIQELDCLISALAKIIEEY